MTTIGFIFRKFGFHRYSTNTIKTPSKPLNTEPEPKLKRQEALHRPRIYINGKPLNMEDGEFVISSLDTQAIMNKIEGQTGNSAVYYLAGSYTTGKTNTLYQVKTEMGKKGFTTVYIDGDLEKGARKWHLFNNRLKNINFVKEYVDSIPSSDDILQNLLNSSNAFNSDINQNATNYQNMKIVICVDESQNFEALDKEFWYQLIRQLIRKRHNVWIVCATSSFDFFKPPSEVIIESLFDVEYFITRFFSRDKLIEGIITLQGKKEDEFFCDISKWIDMIVADIYSETQGHPYLSAYYFLVVRKLMDRVMSTTYSLNIDDIGKEWQFASMFVYQKLSQSRLRNKILTEAPKFKKYVEHSGLLYGNSLNFDKNLIWHFELLRLGLVILTPEKHMIMTCNLMRKFYLEAIQPIIPPSKSIINLCSLQGDINILDIVEILFETLESTPFLKKESWATDKIDPKQSGPSVTLYQTKFFSTLTSICSGSTCWYPIFEMNRGGACKVDLGLICSSTKKKYLIELGVNCTNTGDGSCQFHYERQYEKYYSKNVAGSIVIMIYTNEQHPFYFPKTIHPSVEYLAVGHYMLNPKHIVLQRKGEKQKQIILKS